MRCTNGAFAAKLMDPFPGRPKDIEKRAEDAVSG